MHLELCFLGTHISTYPTISQGKTRIPGVNDGEEFELVDVSHKHMTENDVFFFIHSIMIFICKFYMPTDVNSNSRCVQFFIAGSWNAAFQM